MLEIVGRPAGRWEATVDATDYGILRVRIDDTGSPEFWMEIRVTAPEACRIMNRKGLLPIEAPAAFVVSVNGHQVELTRES